MLDDLLKFFCRALIVCLSKLGAAGQPYRNKLGLIHLCKVLFVSCLGLHCHTSHAQTIQQVLTRPAPNGASSDTCVDAADTLARVRCKGVIKIGIRNNYALFGLDDGRNLAGFEIDLARHFALVLGVVPEFVVVNPADRMAQLISGRVDLVVATMGHTLQRDAEVLFIKPHYYQSRTIVLGRKEVLAPSVSRLRGNTVCVPVGSSTNAELSAGGARLILFDKPAGLVDALRQGGCTFVAHDDSFFATYFQQREFASAYDVKFGFAPLPWGAGVAKLGGERMANVLSLALRELHASGALQTMARTHGVSTPFLEEQRLLWGSGRCAQITAMTQADCVLSPRDDQLDASALAAWINGVEKSIKDATGRQFNFAMLKTRVGLNLVAEGIVFSLLLVSGAVLFTWVMTWIFAACLNARRPGLRWPSRLLVGTLQSVPLLLLMVLMGVLVSALGISSPFVMLLAAVLVLGLFYGAPAGQSVINAKAALLVEQSKSTGVHASPVSPSLSAAVRRASPRLVSAMTDAARGSAAASVIGVPELLATMTDVASFSSERITSYGVVLVFYMLLVALVTWFANQWQERFVRTGAAYA